MLKLRGFPESQNALYEKYYMDECWQQQTDCCKGLAKIDVTYILNWC